MAGLHFIQNNLTGSWKAGYDEGNRCLLLEKGYIFNNIQMKWFKKLSIQLTITIAKYISKYLNAKRIKNHI